MLVKHYKECWMFLDKEIFKSKVKFYAIFIVPILIFVSILTVFYPISSSNLEVTAVKYTAEQTEFGNLTIMWANLDNGKTIRVSMTNNVELRPGGKAEVIQANTLIGISTDKFVRYVN